MTEKHYMTLLAKIVSREGVGEQQNPYNKHWLSR